MTYQLNFYAGAGMTIGGGNSIFILSPDLIVGLEYTVDTFPVNFSIDYKPSFRLFRNEFILDEFALSIRYILE